MVVARLVLGLHWILDAFDCSALRLADAELIREVLLALPKAVALTPVGPPQIHVAPKGSAEEEAVVGLVLISESHLCLHARPAIGTLHADIFSCRRFDEQEAVRFLMEAFRFDRYRQHTIERGSLEPDR